MKKSFTLIELLVVIAIVGILSTLIITRFSNWNDKAKIANTLQWSAGVHRKLGSNLVGYWPLDGDAKDISGYGNNGTLNNGAIFANENPLAGKSSLFVDGSYSQNITINDDYALRTNNNLTISLWVKAGAISEHKTLVNKSLWSEYEFTIAYHLSNPSYFVMFHGDGTNYEVAAAGGIHTEDRWQHVLVTRDGATKQGRIYTNGVLVDSRSFSLDVASSNQDVRIGSRSGSRYITGYISDVRIYDTALTAEEVSRIYAETKDKYLVYE